MFTLFNHISRPVKAHPDFIPLIPDKNSECGFSACNKDTWVVDTDKPNSWWRTSVKKVSCGTGNQMKTYCKMCEKNYLAIIGRISEDPDVELGDITEEATKEEAETAVKHQKKWRRRYGFAALGATVLAGIVGYVAVRSAYRGSEPLAPSEDSNGSDTSNPSASQTDSNENVAPKPAQTQIDVKFQVKMKAGETCEQSDTGNLTLSVTGVEKREYPPNGAVPSDGSVMFKDITTEASNYSLVHDCGDSKLTTFIAESIQTIQESNCYELSKKTAPVFHENGCPSSAESENAKLDIRFIVDHACSDLHVKADWTSNSGVAQSQPVDSQPTSRIGNVIFTDKVPKNKQVTLKFGCNGQSGYFKELNIQSDSPPACVKLTVTELSDSGEANNCYYQNANLATLSSEGYQAEIRLGVKNKSYFSKTYVALKEWYNNRYGNDYVQTWRNGGSYGWETKKIPLIDRGVGQDPIYALLTYAGQFFSSGSTINANWNLRAGEDDSSDTIAQLKYSEIIADLNSLRKIVQEDLNGVGTKVKIYKAPCIGINYSGVAWKEPNNNCD